MGCVTPSWYLDDARRCLVDDPSQFQFFCRSSHRCTEDGKQRHHTHHWGRGFASSSLLLSSSSDDDVMMPEDMANEQASLHREASYLTRTLYWRCLKLADLLAMGNDQDERDFAEKEAHELEELLSSGDGDPTKWGNQLRLRVEYYRAHVRENIDGH